mmetsp:Transcript_6148/g.9439  ORF Transcript_6148/g.9439 Transcript_6148/m.9439 type:complete len:219 (-) Transcript_6148:64-720(-)
METKTDICEILSFKRNRDCPSEDINDVSINSQVDCFGYWQKGKKARIHEESCQFAIVAPNDAEDIEESLEVESNQHVSSKEWWKQNQRRAISHTDQSMNTRCFICCNSMHSTSSSQHPKKSNTLLNYFTSAGTKKSPDAKRQPSVECHSFSGCSFCDRLSCQLCTRQCDVCQNDFCTLCSVVDYHSTHERNFCLDCKSTDRSANLITLEEQNVEMQID